MFPPFDKLVPEEIEKNAVGLDADDRDSRLTMIRALTRLRALWSAATDGRLPAGQDPEWYRSLCRVLDEAPRPADALQATLDYVRQTASPADAFRLFVESPRSLEILSRLSCGSPFLTGILLREPTALTDLSSHNGILQMKSREQFSEEAQKFVRSAPQDFLVSLRRYQHRELLRIGMCDAFGLLTLRCVTLQLSLLADSMVATCLEQACEEAGETAVPLAVIALGKHGGEELNYSSDIDLLLAAENANQEALRIARRLVDALNDHLASGFLYRVDLRLRPWGNAGPLVSTPESFLGYLKTNAELWEKQAMLKARMIAGDEQIGQRLLEGLPDVLHTESAASVRQSIQGMKHKIETRLRREGREDAEVKLGSGSIRDVEFLVQSLQLIHGATEPRLASANTLDALVRLAEFGLLDAFDFQQLRDGYIFLRTLEHALQLLHNQQTHEIPRSPRLRTWLAQRLDYPSADALLNRFEEHRRAIRRVFDRHFLQSDHKSRIPNDTKDRTYTGAADHPVTCDVVKDIAPLDDLIAGLTKKEPVRVHSTLTADDHLVVCTVCAPDEPGLLSAVSGLLFGAGLDIQSGDVISGPGVLRGKSVPAGVFAACLTVGNMQETVESAVHQPDQNRSRIPSDLQDHLTRLLITRRSGGDDAVRQELLQIFCERMRRSEPDSVDSYELRITDYPAEDNSATVVEISAADSAGLLFELVNALNLCGFRIRRAFISAVDGTVHDTLHITEQDLCAPLSSTRQEEIHTAVTLIQQFTLWLPSSTDSLNVLLRFRRLIRKLLLDSRESASADALKSPEVLMQVAQVLGLSRHLWEDALLMHHADVLPLLTHPGRLAKDIPAKDLAARLDRRLQVLRPTNNRTFSIDSRIVICFAWNCDTCWATAGRLEPFRPKSLTWPKSFCVPRRELPNGACAKKRRRKFRKTRSGFWQGSESLAARRWDSHPTSNCY